MELFQVVNRKNFEVLKGFNNKMEAKKFRDTLIPPEQLEEKGKVPMDFVVSYGKDHDKYKGH